MPKPAVMAVNGIAFTLPTELALAAGIVIAADDVRFRQLETGRGIIPSGGATFRAPAQLGWGNAMRFPLTAEEHGTAGALRIELAQEVVPAGAHVQRAADPAQLIAQQAPPGVQATPASARAGLGRGPDAARGCIASLLPGIMRSPHAAEGLRSFTERRGARFTGHRPVPAGRIAGSGVDRGSDSDVEVKARIGSYVRSSQCRIDPSNGQSPVVGDA